MTHSYKLTTAAAYPLVALVAALALAYPALAQTAAPAAGDKEPVTAPKADTPAKDGKDANQLNRVEVIGNNSEAEQRRTSTASRIVIG